MFLFNIYITTALRVVIAFRSTGRRLSATIGRRRDTMPPGLRRIGKDGVGLKLRDGHVDRLGG